MKQKTKVKLTRVGALILFACMLCESVGDSQGAEIKVRTVDVEPMDMSSHYADSFDTCDISYGDNTDEKVVLTATNSYQSDDILFNNVSITLDKEDVEAAIDDTEEAILKRELGTEMEEETEDEYVEPGEDDSMPCDTEDSIEEELENAEVNYECSFDFDELVFEFNAELVTEDGDVLDSEQIITDAIITENGGLDACIIIDDNEYMLSDYQEAISSSVDDCSIIPVMALVKTYLAVAETAEKVKAKSNYKYNRKLEKKGNGVGKGYYIYDQKETFTKNRKSGNYRFGFTTFANVGCEVASAYNCSINLGETERLSQTIYYFEAASIEFSIGWGHLGSNPHEIGRYLEKRGFTYKKYTKWDKFSKAVADKTSCRIIMSRWNNPITSGLHTFFVKKTSNTSFYGYNWKQDSSVVKKKKLSSFNDGSGFICAYIVNN